MKKVVVKLMPILLLLLFNFTSHSQEIEFTLYGKSRCNKKVKQLKYFGLTKEGEDFTPKDSSGFIILKPGKYKLSYVLDEIDTSELNKVYEIWNKEIVSDTINMISIIKYIDPPTTRPNFIGYYCCNNKCDGNQIDYYANGNKRIEGCFSLGKPKGKLIFYYPSGSIRKIEKYNKKGIPIKTKEYKDGEKNK